MDLPTGDRSLVGYGTWEWASKTAPRVPMTAITPAEYYYKKKEFEGKHIIMSMDREKLEDFLCVYCINEGKVDGKRVWTKKAVREFIIGSVSDNLEALELLTKYGL